MRKMTATKFWIRSIMNNPFESFRIAIQYIIAFAAVLFGIYLVFANILGGINRDIGFALITFFTALILIGLTNKKT